MVVPGSGGSGLFSVYPPRGRETPVVVEVPHAGLHVDGETLATMLAPARYLAVDADLHVDRLVQDVGESGAHAIVAHTSRYVVDLNRAEDEHDAFAVQGSRGREAPHGIVWHRTTGGDRILAGPITRRELLRRLDLAYHPYHHALRELVDAKVARFGHCILVAAHSMPSVGRDAYGRDLPRADLVPGTRGRTTAAGAIIDLVEQHAQENGMSVRHDDPYRGGFTTAHYGDPTRRVHAIQLEIARRRYMDERTLAESPSGVDEVRRFYATLTKRLGAMSSASFLLS